MTVSNSMLLWLVEVMDKGSLPTAEALRIKSLLDDLNQSIQRAAFISSVPVTDELQRTLKDIQHTSTYIHGAVPELSPLVGKTTWTGGGVVPSHMDQSFAGKQPIHIENLVATNVTKGMENVKQFASVSQVDLLQKDKFEDKETPPAPGEVADFVAQREAETVNEEVYTDMSALKYAFLIPNAETCVIGYNRIDAYKLPEPFFLQNLEDYNFVARSTYNDDAGRIEYVGFDPDTTELIVVDKGEAYRVAQTEFATLIQDEIPAYDGRVVARIVKSLKDCSGDVSGAFAQVDISTYKIADGYLLVSLKHVSEGSEHISFITTDKTFNKYFGEQTA